MVAIPASVVPTFLEGVVRADAAVVDVVEGTSSQQASPQIRKPLARNVLLGQGVGTLTEFFHELNRLSGAGVTAGQRVGG